MAAVKVAQTSATEFCCQKHTKVITLELRHIETVSRSLKFHSTTAKTSQRLTYARPSRATIPMTPTANGNSNLLYCKAKNLVELSP